MPEGLGHDDLVRTLSDVNSRDVPALQLLTERLAQRPTVGADLARFRDGLRLGGLDGAFTDGLAPLGFDVDASTAKAFVSVLTAHPAFADDRRLGVGLAILGESDGDPGVAAARREAAELLVAGAFAFGVLGMSETLVDPLVHVAFGAEAFSGVLRRELLGRPRLGEEVWPVIPDWLTEFGPAGDWFDCVLGIQHALTGFMLAVRGIRSDSYATGITSLTPNVGCAGQTVTIIGTGFGPSQPADVSVLFPHASGSCVEAAVTSWSDTSIAAVAPPGVSTGCVGFHRQAVADAGELTAASGALAGELEGCLGMAASAVSQRLRKAGPVGVVSCPPCLPGGANRFSGGGPTIAEFTGNGGTDIIVEHGTYLVLRWRVLGATSVALSRTSTTGPFMTPPGSLPPIGSHFVGWFFDSKVITATYRLVASNPCGSVSRTVTVRLRKTPAIAVTRIEVVQAIQRRDNSVRLVSGKRTMVRVFVSSGLTGGFDNGAGPDIQPGVTGVLIAYPESSRFGHNARDPVPSVINAQPAGAIDRSDRTHSLNFELPLAACTGRVRLDVVVGVKEGDRYLSGPFQDTASTTVTFHNQPTQGVEPYLIVDVVNGLPAPSLARYDAALQQARTRFPIAETGFVVAPPVSFSTGSWRNLCTIGGWSSLLNALATLAFVHTGAIRTGLVPRDPGTLTILGMPAGYPVNGMAFPRVGATMPALLAQAGVPATFAHEMGHTFSLNHAPCCTNFWDNQDGRLPGRTEDVGFDVPGDTVIPAGRGELMSYCGDLSRCGGPTRWPSIATWNILFDSMGI